MGSKDKLFISISFSRVKKMLIGLGLLGILLTIAVYEIPTTKVWKYWSLPLAGVTIALDAGHGGPDGGAVSKQGIIEKDINLAVALYLRDYLQQAGAIVVMTREDDRDLAGADTKGYKKRKSEDLKQRVRFIEENEAKLFLSIHMNSVPSSRWSGAQTFYNKQNEDSVNLAQLVQQELKVNLENTDRVAKQSDKTVYLLEALKIPAVLVEVGFLSHPEESKWLKDDAYQRKVAGAIYKGILRYTAGEKSEN
ncbi:N-acetylmuramoyl-L-alanine amidase [Paenibacillus anaericanus]|uniref:N-acetylmuramoyl-L-alanine amidase CwlD n=1 Tax=Paenibacillus anaericanus TaxID=170367 RepID=UPI00278A98E0|nr:N-acetylmuramoyl-L-alanine amidase CwlD [Paenibacillus anaericanus]MDQ0091854.1 N-acetylmuramoyl-L-alanine amidase [Paenibacillus anaericanus]